MNDNLRFGKLLLQSEPVAIGLVALVCLLGIFYFGEASHWKPDVVVSAIGSFGQVAVAGGAFLIARSSVKDARNEAARARAERKASEESLFLSQKENRTSLHHEKSQAILAGEMREGAQLAEKIVKFDALSMIASRYMSREEVCPIFVVIGIMELYSEFQSRDRFRELVSRKSRKTNGLKYDAIWEMAERSLPEPAKLDDIKSFDFLRKEFVEGLRLANQKAIETAREQAAR